MKCIKVLKILWIECLCTLDEFSDEWNEEELLESLFNLLTLLLSLLTLLPNLLLFDSSEPFIILWRCNCAIMLSYNQDVISVGESNPSQYDLTVEPNEKA